MKFRKTMTAIFLAVVAVSFAIPAWSALDSSVVDGAELIKTDKNAPGTKLIGPLTIYYHPTGLTEVPPGSLEMPDIIADMYVFMRLRKGNDLYSFSTVIPGVLYLATDVTLQQKDIEGFIRSTVIPKIFPDIPAEDSAETCTEDCYKLDWAIKFVEEGVQDNNGEYEGCCSYPVEDPITGDSVMKFAIMDVTIAVVE